MRLPQTLLVLALLGIPASGAGAGDGADPRVGWLRDYAVPLSTIDPAVPGTEDLAPLKEVLSEVRVVLLGEATRGDGSAFLAKTRLIRFLHEELDFDLLILEGDFHGCAAAARAIEEGTDPREALRPALLPLYTDSAQLEPLFELLARRGAARRPLTVAGMDPQLGRGGASRIDDLEVLLRRLESAPEEIPGFQEMEAIVGHLAAEAYATGEEPIPPEAVRERFLRTLEEVDRLLARGARDGGEAAPGPGTEHWRQVVENLRTAAHLAWEQGILQHGRPASPHATNLRNRQMAENILWHLDRHPESKAVVWSLNILLARDLGRLETGDLQTKARLERFVTVGDLLGEALGHAVYAVGFTAARGRSGTPFREPYALLEPTPGSFEDLMDRTGLEAAFVDLRGLDGAGPGARWLRDPLIAKPLSYLELRGSWHRHLDAFLFLRSQDPSRRAGGSRRPP